MPLSPYQQASGAFNQMGNTIQGIALGLAQQKYQQQLAQQQMFLKLREMEREDKMGKMHGALYEAQGKLAEIRARDIEKRMNARSAAGTALRTARGFPEDSPQYQSAITDMLANMTELGGGDIGKMYQEVSPGATAFSPFGLPTYRGGVTLSPNQLHYPGYEGEPENIEPDAQGMLRPSAVATKDPRTEPSKIVRAMGDPLMGPPEADTPEGKLYNAALQELLKLQSQGVAPGQSSVVTPTMPPALPPRKPLSSSSRRKGVGSLVPMQVPGMEYMTSPEVPNYAPTDIRPRMQQGPVVEREGIQRGVPQIEYPQPNFSIPSLDYMQSVEEPTYLPTDIKPQMKGGKILWWNPETQQLQETPYAPR